MEDKTSLSLEATPIMTKREQRIAEYKRRYPLRSSRAYKRLLPTKIYRGGQLVSMAQVLIMIGMALGAFLEKPWHSFLIPASLVVVFLCMLIVGLDEEQGDLYDNWRLSTYEGLTIVLATQLFLTIL